MFKKVSKIISFFLVIMLVTGTFFLVIPTKAKAEATPNIDKFLKSKYGIFSHYAYGQYIGGLGVTEKTDGTYPSSLDDLANNFNAQQYAADVASWGMEYVVFTAWHAGMNCLYPSQVMSQWRTGQHGTTNTDVIRELINALRPYGIDLYLYTHPADGMDFSTADQTSTGWNDSTNNYQTWNNFINDAYDELLTRYGSDIKGILFDSGFPEQVDQERLRATLDSHNTDYARFSLVSAPTTTDYNCKEMNGENLWFTEYTPNASKTDVNTWWGYNRMLASVASTEWWAKGSGSVRYSAQEMYLQTVVQAATNTQGGGVAWSFAPYPGGTWESGIKSTFDALWNLMEPVAESIKGTLHSKSYPTAEGQRIGDLDYVATESPDGKCEYIHVLKAPSGNTINLPLPQDYKYFYDGTLLANGHNVAVTQDSSGVHIKLLGSDTWNSLDTVIKLKNSAKSETIDVAIGKTATANSGDGSKAVDGSAAQPDGWYGATGPQSLVVDLGQDYPVSQFIIKHESSWGGDAGYNTKDYKIQWSDSSGGPWTDIVNVNGNTQGVTLHNVDTINKRYFRLYITNPSNNSSTDSRIYEFEIRCPVTNVALRKTTTTNGGNGAKAVDGSYAAADGWAGTGSTPQTLVVDLGSSKMISAFKLVHAGPLSGSAAYNTKGYKIQVSDSAGGPWTDVVTVQNNTQGMTFHTITPVEKKYVRLYITNPNDNMDNVSRIMEFEVYALPRENLALNKNVTANAGDGSKAVDGSAAQPDGWYDATGPQTLVVDLGGQKTIKEFILYHESSWGGDAGYNAKDYKIQVSDNSGGPWTDVVTANGNTAGITRHVIDPVSKRYVRLYITTPSNNTDTASRIYEFEIY